MSTTKEELVAANIRRQIAYLEGLLKDLESEPEHTPQFVQQFRTVESQLHILRTQLAD